MILSSAALNLTGYQTAAAAHAAERPALKALLETAPALPPPAQQPAPVLLPTALRSGSDVFSHLLHFQKRIFLWGPLTEEAAAAAAAQLLLLQGEQRESSKEEKMRSRMNLKSPKIAAAANPTAAAAAAAAEKARVELIINSRGGPLSAALALYDVLGLVSGDLLLKTLAVGCVGHSAALLLSSGLLGKRKAAKNAKIFFCQSACTAQGSADELLQQAAAAAAQEQLFDLLLAKRCGRTAEEIASWRQQSKVFSAEEAKAVGLIDEIISE
ncbi:hypothetical protein ETH_00030480 [Eimeria tenella]|uniref:ATP-dependent Clp protease proteolytic subunit n=2 Tax=Eimeria tenella TaxID=5802 RepID=U6KR30_EIMTE|nr:hypothetical protein ETH_00030480 [Eimeria tenella]CDJ37868.1 hypothetical protein ETH_00030480 [Eimeria tenella]|eukprot:XP_013228706.1 hypothetical protein ETH_00030480 [Eimeria tenella]